VVSRAATDARSVTRATYETTHASSELSPREREVLSLLAADVSLYEIAERLSISHTTVRNHVQHILSKLAVHSTLEAVAVWLLDAPRS
jgi:DNA-binding NarL/FixJ family response regulator